MTEKSYRKEIHGNNPYYDDYDASKKFVRVLSRPGYPLQAREITQLQTLLQSQIERFGSHVFEEGATVRGGEIVEAQAQAVRLTDTNFNDTTLRSFLNKTVVNEQGVRAKIVSYADKSPTLTNDPNQILLVNYTSSGGFTGGQTLTIQGTLPVQTINIGSTGTAPAIDTASNVVCVKSGIFFADGFFIEADDQSFAAFNTSADGTYRNYGNPTCSIGLGIKRDVIGADEDNTLKDPSFGFYNFNSPGADRYKIELLMDQRNVGPSGGTLDAEDYIELVRIVNGQSTKRVKYTDYALFEDTLARRTFDESGNYTVRPFTVTPIEYGEAFGVGNGAKHAIKIGAGKAYISGYEFETISPSFFEISRALETETLYAQPIQTPLTNYVKIDKSDSYDARSGDERLTYTRMQKGVIQRDNRTRTNTSVDFIETLGTCNIRTIEQVGEELRLYLFNINMATGGSGFALSTHIALDDKDPANNTRRYKIGSPNVDTELKNVGSGRQIFKAPIGSALIKTWDEGSLPSSFTIKKGFTFDMGVAGSTAIVDGGGQAFLDGTQRNYTLFYTTNLSDTGSSGGTALNYGTDYTIVPENSFDTSQIRINLGSNIPTGGKGTIIASQNWTSGTIAKRSIRNKDLEEVTRNGLSGSAETGIVYLDHADVFGVLYLSDKFREVTNEFELDVNAGVDCYRRSRIIRKPGTTGGLSGDALHISTATYNKFTHSGDGPFTVDSYPQTSRFGYSNIPTYTDPETGESFSLSDAFDFRPIVLDAAETGFDNGSGAPQVIAFENGVNVPSVSYQHYLSRIDKVILKEDRNFSVIQGIPSATPTSPQAEEGDMVLGTLDIPAYTGNLSAIDFRYNDNQRTTMAGINEIEQSQQFDQFFIFRNDLQSEALNRAQNFRNTRTAFTEGIFVDTIIGHQNAVTRGRDHNCSIDPEVGEIRPSFESRFYGMGGASGASLPAGVTQSADGIYHLLPSSSNITRNEYASRTRPANSFSVADYLGTLKISPASDPYFSVLKKPRVIVNTVGEVDNWEQSISAFQRGRARGFGSQWRDWESIWFGSSKRNDINIEHETNGSQYASPRRSSYVSRIISDKILEKIGNKVVDLSVVPYIRARTLTYEANGLKPNTRHFVRFDGRSNGSSKFTDDFGGLTGSVAIVSGQYLTGEKLIRITNTTDGSLTLATSSCDAIYYAKGLYQTREGDSYSVRPAITRRKASNVEDVSSDRYDANASNNISETYNSITPLAQEFNVDPSQYPNGLMLNNIELFFAKTPATGVTSAPVKISVRPIYNGSPDPYKILPFSEVTLPASDVSATKADASPGEGTEFKFSTPVYLKPNTKYAICISTNDSDYILWTGEKGRNSIKGEFENTEETNNQVTVPLYMGGLHLPQNNGSVYTVRSEFIKMGVDINLYATSQDDPTQTAVFSTNAAGTKEYHVSYLSANNQVCDAARPKCILKTKNITSGSVDEAVELTKTLHHTSKRKIDDRDATNKSVQLSIIFRGDGYVTTMIDQDRLGLLAVEYMANGDDAAASLEELKPTARLATNRSRYVGRKVSLDREADDMVVLVDGSFIGSSKIRVYVKTQGTSGTQGVFDDNPWQELYPEGDPLPGRFQELKPLGDVGGMMRFSTDKLNPGLGDFSSYQIKILLMGPSANNDGNSMEIPKLSSVAAVPLRRISQDEIRRYVPVGSIMAYAGDAIPYGFAECNGDMYDFGADPEYKVLFDVIGTQYNIGGETTNQYRVPDLRSRVPVGLGSVGQVELDAARTARSMGATGGVEKMPQHEHRMFPLSSTSTILSGGGGTDFEYFGAQPFRDFSLGRIGDEDSSSGGGGPQLWGPNNTGVNPAAGYVRTQTKGYLGAEGVPAGSVKFEETTEAASYKEEANMTPYQVTKYIIKI